MPAMASTMSCLWSSLLRTISGARSKSAMEIVVMRNTPAAVRCHRARCGHVVLDVGDAPSGRTDAVDVAAPKSVGRWRSDLGLCALCGSRPQGVFDRNVLALGHAIKVGAQPGKSMA